VSLSYDVIFGTKSPKSCAGFAEAAGSQELGAVRFMSIGSGDPSLAPGPISPARCYATSRPLLAGDGGYELEERISIWREHASAGSMRRVLREMLERRRSN